MKQSEEWIDSIINSTQGIRRVEMDSMLQQKILSRINSRTIQLTPLPARVIYRAAAAIALLLALNIVSINQLKQRSEVAKQLSGSFAQEYFSYMNNNPF